MKAGDDQQGLDHRVDPVVEFYEEHPYPPPVADLDADLADWAEPERRRAEYHLLFPTQSFREDLDVLVAGCGTFQAARHAVRWPAGRIVGIDVSATSIEHTVQLQLRHDLTNLRVEQLPVEKAANLDGDFDLIVCTGVLHHLLDPDEGLRALRNVLRPGGVMLIMVYAPYGRAGVAMMQEYSRLLGIGLSRDEIRDLAGTLVEIPEDHPLGPLFRRSPDFRRFDALADALLNPRETAFSVPELLSYLERNGLAFGRWYRQAQYLPQCGVLRETPHARRLRELPPADQYAAVELFRGTMARHSVIIHRDDDPADWWRYGPGGAGWLDSVPIRRPQTLMIEERLPPGAAAVLINRSHTYADLVLPIDAKEKMLVDAIDGQRSIASLAGGVTEGGYGSKEDLRRFIDRLFWHDQVVFDTTREVATGAQ